MKSIQKNFLLWLTSFFIQWIGWIPQALSHINDLKDYQAYELLDSLDHQCGDTWCEGSYDIRFNELHCSFKEKECFLRVSYINDYNIKDADERDCVFLARSLDDLYSPVETGPLPAYPSDYFIDKINECLSDL